MRHLAATLEYITCNFSSLQVRPVQYADVASCAALRTATLGSLVIGHLPPFPGYQEDQMTSIESDLANKPHVHHLKVVDTDGNDNIIAYAKWQIYKHRRPDLEALEQPIGEASKCVDRYGRLREAAHEYFCSRNGQMRKHPHVREFGQGQIVLALRMLIPWSRSLGSPCYV